MEDKKDYRVLLYYKFINIESVEDFAKHHLEFCKSLGIKGRILVASEGINGTVSGETESIEEYMKVMKDDSRFKDMVFKIDEVEKNAFKKIFVRERKSIITLNTESDVNPNEITGKYLSPEEFCETLQDENVIVIDGRNDYEYEIGHFRNAIKPDVKAFKEFPKWIDENLSQHKDKKIITYCTGGIRCEKLSGVLLNKGFKDVGQLEGGIVTYGKDEKVKGKLFDGKCYVFDERISVKVNNTNEDIIISKCSHCGKPSDRYINCANDACHDQHICCKECENTYEGFCSSKCTEYVILNPDKNGHLRKLKLTKN
ncbi:rhodanese domain-containing protein [Clostridium putrefaciens]|uniref:tRNA uridine(34) hydroxylase n=1 Tax=Clostridium putrefaciens TaxID=99675 RepID=A0A381JAU0_9CLOT|nr:rhodanese-related sulfurtransferase [Clostridium putrefaciens]SUY47556.1 rhodanese domain-containing protein [Clostridium putrefaciens]